MVTKRFLRIALLCLLAFTFFCLIVLEVTLNDRRLSNNYRVASSNATNAFFRYTNKDDPSTENDVTSKHDVSFANQTNGDERTKDSTQPSKNTNNVANIVTNTSSSATTANLSQSSSSSSGGGGGEKSANATVSSTKAANTTTLITTRANTTTTNTTTTTTNTTKQSTLNITTSIDYCAKDVVVPTIAPLTSTHANNNIAKDASAPADSRPDSCTSCFNTEFTALIENCEVCGVGRNGADGRERAVVELVMVILTTHAAQDKRQAIRETWGSVADGNKGTIRRVFLLGRAKVSLYVLFFFFDID
jgi:hypothetical protein